MVNPETAKIHFRHEARYVQDIISVTLDSCRSALQEGVRPADWQPPLQRVFLGVMQETLASSPSEFLRLAAPLSSLAYRDSLGEGQEPPSKPKARWSIRVRDKVLVANGRFKRNFDVHVHPGNHNPPAVFGFLCPSFAANLTALSSGNLAKQLREARSKLWTLNLLEDVPNYLFKPERRELLTGIDIQTDDPQQELIRETAEELDEDGARRARHTDGVRQGSCPAHPQAGLGGPRNLHQIQFAQRFTYAVGSRCRNRAQLPVGGSGNGRDAP